MNPPPPPPCVANIPEATPTLLVVLLINNISIIPHAASEDFVPRENLAVTFAAGESERFVEVMIINDNVYETQECFMAVLELPTGSTGVQLGQQSQANVVLFDDDGTRKPCILL